MTERTRSKEERQKAREEALADLHLSIDLSANDILDRTIKRHEAAAAARLPPEKRAELHARLDKDLTFIRQLVEEQAYILAREIVQGLKPLCNNGTYGVGGEKGSGETDGMAQVLPMMELCLRDLQTLQDEENASST